MRLSVVIQFLMLIIIGCGVYTVANQYQIIEKQVKRFEAQSGQERENIRVLQAEWAFLTNPTRLEKIAAEHFQLQPVDGTQMVALNTMPLREMLDAQMVETNIADNNAAVIMPKENLPQGVTPVVEQNMPQTASIAKAMPSAAALPPAQALPPLDITPVSDQRGVQ